MVRWSKRKQAVGLKILGEVSLWKQLLNAFESSHRGLTEKDKITWKARRCRQWHKSKWPLVWKLSYTRQMRAFGSQNSHVCVKGGTYGNFCCQLGCAYGKATAVGLASIQKCSAQHNGLVGIQKRKPKVVVFFPFFFSFFPTDARTDYIEIRMNNSTRNGRMPRLWNGKVMPQVRHPVLGCQLGQRSHAFPFCWRSVFALHKMRIVMFNGLCKVPWVGMKGIWTLFLSLPLLVEWCWASSFALPQVPQLNQG